MQRQRHAAGGALDAQPQGGELAAKSLQAGAVQRIWRVAVIHTADVVMPPRQCLLVEVGQRCVQIFPRGGAIRLAQGVHLSQFRLGQHVSIGRQMGGGRLQTQVPVQLVKTEINAMCNF